MVHKYSRIVAKQAAILTHEAKSLPLSSCPTSTANQLLKTMQRYTDARHM